MARAMHETFVSAKLYEGARFVSIRGTLRGVLLASAIACSLGGCITLDELLKKQPLDSLRHEHNNYCGHAYLGDVHLDPCPRDFAGAEAWRGPLWENEIRVKDPWRGDRPQPERPVPYWMPGGGTSEHADRQPPHKGTDGSPEAGGAYPHWPVEDDRPETAGE